MDKKEADGISRRDHLERVEKQTKKTMPQLEKERKANTELVYLWGWYCEIKNFSESFTWQSIHSWILTTKRSLSRWEINALLMIEKLQIEQSRK